MSANVPEPGEKGVPTAEEVKEFLFGEEECPDCGGSGKDTSRETGFRVPACTTCHGTGKVRDSNDMHRPETAEELLDSIRDQCGDWRVEMLLGAIDDLEDYDRSHLLSKVEDRLAERLPQ